MNKLSMAGAILVIIAAAFMSLWGIVIIATWGLLSIIPLIGPLMVILAIFMLGIGITSIVLSSLVLAGKKNLVIITGIFAIIGLFFAWIAYIFPTILLLLGAILLFCSMQKETDLEEEIARDNKISKELVPDLEN